MAKHRTKADARPHHLISGLEITGGFLKGLKLEFADGLNCIIGGRGTGKTTVLEFVRYVLGLMPDAKATAGALARSRRSSRRTSPRQIRIAVRTKHGIGYNAERPWNDAARSSTRSGVATRDLARPRSHLQGRRLQPERDRGDRDDPGAPARAPRQVRRRGHAARRVRGRKVMRELEENASALLASDARRASSGTPLPRPRSSRRS